jgi:hypothetical protein
MAKQHEKKQDASLDVTLNGVRVTSQRIADRLRVPVGEKVAWAIAFPRPELDAEPLRQAA